MKRKIYISFLVVCVIFFVTFVVFEFVLFPTKFKKQVTEISSEYGLETALVYAIIKAESSFKPNAVSHAGAVGLMQLLPSTAKWIAEEVGDVFDYNQLFVAEKNIEYGCFYLDYLFDKFVDIDIVVCAYNAGETKVRDWILDGVLVQEKIDYEETREYLRKVKRFYEIYKNKEKYL